MILMRNIITAITSRTWINPPIAYPPINPTPHNTSKTIAMVVSIMVIF